jgi:glycosyltransferase involved in cell wall biosynthesis
MISYVIPAYDEERLLGATLVAIHEAARAVGEPYEIVVANDASSDRTADVALEHGARVVTFEHRQIAATRNSGARAALGDRFIFVDADTLVNEAVVRAAIQALNDGAVGGGASVLFDGRVPLYAKIVLPMALWVFRVSRLAPGCFLFCTRHAFEAVGGYDERLFGAEELAISKAMKRQGRFVILRQTVTTSGRKLRAYSGWEVLRILSGLAIRGRNSVRSRRGLEIWYEKRREEPDPTG